ncbi:spore protease YyaC [Bacillus taeanensis]|uniref:Spore protease YyaC n=1 Tax=Bacillus taeanensis TaxID=273032 RepID=A0A366XU98_9BACI|nr:spore protease YyaC [Bacillus taeanensis]RBW69138.1 spore protease YyaC [Bacillus taeanensis]
MNLREKIFPKKPSSFRIHYEEMNVLAAVTAYLNQLLPKDKDQEIIIVCIGTDRSTGDALGPLVGSRLMEKINSSFTVYGTLEAPVHAVNLGESLNYIKESHVDPFIIGVDACLGRVSSVGMISIGEGPVKPGAGVRKELPSVGNIHLTGIVNVSGMMEYFVLQNTRLHLVISMAHIIADSLHLAILERNNTSTIKTKINPIKPL